MQACINTDMACSYEFNQPRRACTTIRQLVFPGTRISITPSHGRLHVLDDQRGGRIAVVDVPEVLLAAAEVVLRATSEEDRQAAQAGLDAAWKSVGGRLDHWFRYQ